MKIGLIGINRYADYLNFACNLHAFAFQQYLTNRSYDATFVDYKPVHFENMDLREPAKFAEAKYRSTIAAKANSPAAVKQRNADARRWTEVAMGYRAPTEERKARYDKFEAFISENMGFTAEVYDSDLLEVEDPGIDCYICVTAVIWQPWLPDYSFDRGYMLGSKAFEGKPKIAYAPSRGARSDFEPESAKEFFNYLEDIDSISARERDFSQYIEENTGRTVPTVVDPVLLHDQEFWTKVAIPPPEQKYVLLYYVMERSTDTVAKAVEYAKAHSLTVVELSDRPLPHGKLTDPGVRHVPRYDVSAEEWLGYIAHADAVFTNSFHGCCFSLIFDTLFFVCRRNGNKVPNFLSEFSLTSQQFSPEDSVANLGDTVDFTRARTHLDNRRRQSEEFLLTALHEAEASTGTSSTADRSRLEARRREITYTTHFHSGALVNSSNTTAVGISENHQQGLKVKKLKSGALEYSTPGSINSNDGTGTMGPNLFQTPTHRLAGWTLRFRIDNRWFWLLNDGTVIHGDTKGADLDYRKMVLDDGGRIPHVPVNSVSSAVFVARWRKVYIETSKPSVKSKFVELKNKFSTR
ncbi:polysaccharide pyruvyl transferase family protein [Brevibacterium sp. UCMA 11752]|uniref:polysaccharide pyruvyl transferase family protein n=1 Tax=Brevibacterium sp. UCMA 11752 TaxID=2745946 RepID=UPI001F41CD5E|nr:polysaccharide pyruvyl transferase family protein [Brevibacterium sp. UCMA 11752]MCF2587204.1 polysaccharide pyruvyl transferase family protein [Brevibacterium sp. UCMA 11752]